MVDVRTEILTRRLAALPSNSTDRTPLEDQLTRLTQQRNLVASTVNMIARRASSVNSGDYFAKVTTERMSLTHHECFKTATQRIQEKCFDLHVSNY
jgi:hypothetical protein